MKKRYLILLWICLGGRLSNADSVPTIGPIPKMFPRDPIEVNTFPEHMIFGQIMETLVTADKEGKVHPGIAASWKILENGRRIEFILRKDKKFSDGRDVTCADVKYSLERHMQSRASQSKAYLSGIIDIICEQHLLTMKLKEPNMAIFKVLSRDHLGVLPKNWIFDPNSNEPYIGSGPYRVFRQDKKWFASLNSFHSPKSEKAIPKWEIVFKPEEYKNISEIPDAIPFATEQLYKELKLISGFEAAYDVRPQLSFVQSSAWWWPYANNSEGDIKKIEIVWLVSKLVQYQINKYKLVPGTGPIPVGVAGALKVAPQTPAPEVVKRQVSRPLEMRIAVAPTLMSFFEESTIRAFEESHKCNLKIVKIDYSESLDKLKEKKVDIYFGHWAGGFNDPEGFLAVVGKDLGLGIEDYIPEFANVYFQARREQDWTVRADLYRKLGAALVENSFVVPGWKTPTFAIFKKVIRYTETGFRYTPRWIDAEK